MSTTRAPKAAAVAATASPASPQDPAAVAEVTPSADDGEVAVELLTLSVRCTRPQGIWRAGRFWTAETTDVPAVEFDQAQLDAILSEPLLSVNLTAQE